MKTRLPDISTLTGHTIRVRLLGRRAWKFFFVCGVCEDDPRRQLVVSKFNLFGVPTEPLYCLPVWDTDNNLLAELVVVDFEGK